MTDQLVDVRTALASSARTRVEIGRDGVLHVLAGPVTLHLDRAVCEELATTLAKAMVALAQAKPKHGPPRLVAVVPASARPRAATEPVAARPSARSNPTPRKEEPE